MPRNCAEFHIIGQVGKIDVRPDVTYVNIASNHNRRVNDEWVERTRWNRVICFKAAKESAERASVGDLVRVTGVMEDTSYEDEGRTIYSTDRIAESFSVLSRANSDRQNQGQGEECGDN